MMHTKHECPACGYFTFVEPPPGTYDICPVCGWEDDDTQFNDPAYDDGANDVSLDQARRNFAEFGAVTKAMAATVREPTDDEKPA